MGEPAGSYSCRFRMPIKEAPMGKRSSEVWPSLRAKIEHSLDKTDPNGCWVWMGEKTPHGYGQVHWNGKSPYVHRSYLIELGRDVPDGMDVDHLCRNHSCVNPDHLEVVSHTENVLRGVGYAATNARKTHCKHGHEFTPENTYISKRKGQTSSGWYLKRVCRTCRREQRATRRNATGNRET